MDTNTRNYIAKEGELYVEDFMTAEEHKTSEEQQMDEKEFDFNKGQFNILSKLIINKDKFILQRPGSINEDYIIEKRMGEGATGSVFKATNKVTNVERAIK